MYTLTGSGIRTMLCTHSWRPWFLMRKLSVSLRDDGVLNVPRGLCVVDAEADIRVMLAAWIDDRIR